MTRPEDLACAHEPFGDAFYFGPEHLGQRFSKDLDHRESSGFIKTTYKDVLDTLLDQDKRVFIKDMAYYLFAPNGKPTGIAPSLVEQSNGVDTASTGPDGSSGSANPMAIPLSALSRFQYAFLIRHPRRSIPSYYRCTVPPLVEATHFNEFMPCEAGYKELRQMVDYLIEKGLVDRDSIVVLDADDMLDRPAEAIEAFCKGVDLDYRPEMLQWEDAASQDRATAAFEKWAGWHNDALASTGLQARAPSSSSAAKHKTPPTTEEEDAAWLAKFGDKGQKIIRSCVDANTADYDYLKQFALKF